MQHDLIMRWPVCLGCGGFRPANTRRQDGDGNVEVNSSVLQDFGSRLPRVGMRDERVLGGCEQLFVPSVR